MEDVVQGQLIPRRNRGRGILDHFLTVVTLVRSEATTNTSQNTLKKRVYFAGASNRLVMSGRLDTRSTRLDITVISRG